MSLKIVYIHHSGTYGGSSRSIGILIKELSALGVEAHIISPPGRVIDYFKQITPFVYTLNHRSFPLTMTIVGLKNNGFHFFRNMVMVKNIGRIKSIVQGINPDLIHCNDFGLVWVARMLKKLNFPIIMHARTMPHKGFPLLNIFVVKQINKYCDHLICISGSVYNAMTNVDRKSILYNPIETDAEVKPKQNDKKVINFISLSAIQKSKGVFDIAAAANVLKNDFRIKIIIAGKINRHDPSSLTTKEKVLKFLGLIDFEDSNRLLNYIDENQLDNIELLDHVEDIHKLLATADVLLAPMHLNAPPRSIYEAGIHEVPSILSMEDKVEDVVENGVNGLLIDEQSPDQLVTAMLELVNHQDLRIKLGQQARERFLVNHNVSNIARDILQVYRQYSK